MSGTRGLEALTTDPNLQRLLRALMDRVREFDRRQPAFDLQTVQDTTVRPAAERHANKRIFVRGTSNSAFISDGTQWVPLAGTSAGYAVPTITYGTTAADGVLLTSIRSDSRLKFPTALMSSTTSSTLTLTDDGTNQTITGDFPAQTGILRFISKNRMQFESLTGLFDFVDPDGVTVRGQLSLSNSNVTYPVFFSPVSNNNDQAAGAGLLMNITMIAHDAAVTLTSRYGISTEIDYNIVTSNTSAKKIFAYYGTLTGDSNNTLGNNAGDIAGGLLLQLGIPTGPFKTNAGNTLVNAYGVLTDPSNVLGNTITNVYSTYGKTWSVASTNYYGARYEGASTGTPTVAYNYYADAHSVGTTKWAFYGDGDASHFAGIDIKDAKDVVLGSTTGTKIGTATTQKLGFWNSSPVVQPATTGTILGFTAGGGAAVDDKGTFTGNTGATAYTISDIVKNLKTCGILKT